MAAMGEMRNVCTVCLLRTKGRCSESWEDNIKLKFREKGLRVRIDFCLSGRTPLGL
jgi:hypothetical protein